ncbi:CopG family ribbon-helix-helix protein [Terrarubrum flagellatum]|uniref:CopG family ribbon-helix-helix protein n=1 Tax=Terrirubrum flagellatum TaxID=2895980 RepID=UPI0031456230
MTDTTITVRVSSELKDKLEHIAKATRRSKSFLANEAIARYVETEAEIIAGIEEGLEDVKAGRVIPHEQVVREAKAIIENARRRSAAE